MHNSAFVVLPGIKSHAYYLLKCRESASISHSDKITQTSMQEHTSCYSPKSCYWICQTTGLTALQSPSTDSEKPTKCSVLPQNHVDVHVEEPYHLYIQVSIQLVIKLHILFTLDPMQEFKNPAQAVSLGFIQIKLWEQIMVAAVMSRIIGIHQHKHIFLGKHKGFLKYYLFLKKTKTNKQKQQKKKP